MMIKDFTVLYCLCSRQISAPMYNIIGINPLVSLVNLL